MEQRERDISQPAASADQRAMQQEFFSGTGKAISTNRVHFTRLNLLKGKLANAVFLLQKATKNSINLDWKAPQKGKIINTGTELQWPQLQSQPSARNICGLTFAEMC